MNTGTVQLHYREQGRGRVPVLFLHGNLGCGDWSDLVAQRLPSDMRLIAPDWRGCGDSPKPEPLDDYANYSMATHAGDMLALLDRLGVDHCDLFTHSTGDLIATHMLLAQPARFGRVVSISPVGPMGLPFTEEQIQGFRIMRDHPAIARSGVATAVSSLFRPESLAAGGGPPVFRDEVTEEQRTLFERVLARTQVLSDGIWVGTPLHLDRTYRDGTLRQRQAELDRPRLILQGAGDAWIPRADVQEMASTLPHCDLRIIEGVGHSLNVEAPDVCTEALVDFLRLAPNT